MINVYNYICATCDSRKVKSYKTVVLLNQISSNRILGLNRQTASTLALPVFGRGPR